MTSTMTIDPPLGSYHGITVKSGTDTLIMSGSPVVFVAEEVPERPVQGIEAEQLSLF